MVLGLSWLLVKIGEEEKFRVLGISVKLLFVASTTFAEVEKFWELAGRKRPSSFQKIGSCIMFDGVSLAVSSGKSDEEEICCVVGISIELLSVASRTSAEIEKFWGLDRRERPSSFQKIGSHIIFDAAGLAGASVTSGEEDKFCGVGISMELLSVTSRTFEEVGKFSELAGRTHS